MRSNTQQDGLTVLGVLFILFLVFVAVALVFKLAPVYLEYYNVVSSVNSLKEDPDLSRLDKEEILKRLKRRFEINDVWRLSMDDVKISEQQGNRVVTVDYEVIIPLVANIDFLLKFHKSLKIR